MTEDKKITVLGATGQMGTQVVRLLTAAGHRVVAASRASGVDVASGTGLDGAFAGAGTVIDVTNSATQEDRAAFEFFEAASSNVMAAVKRASVDHYVVLSIVGADRLSTSGYMRGKVAQEQAAAASGRPFTIVRATQFHEFTVAITESLICDGEVRAPDALIQPVASAEVADTVARLASAGPVGGILEVGGPEKMSFAELAHTVLAQQGRDLRVGIAADATYFGIPVQRTSLVTGDGAELTSTRLADWLVRHAPAR